ncbi:MAG: hypothetical protein IKC83_03460 [Clostridia bacterium]|nr:hypothetical protein [Clostridia bacterium]
MKTQGSYALATWIGQIILASLNLLVFEIVANFYYGFLRPIQPAPITQTAFLEYLRISYVLRNVMGGAVKFIFYKSDIAVFGFDAMIGVIVTTLILASTFIYVMQKYVPLCQKNAFLKCVSVPYIVYQALCVGVVLL